MDAVHSALRKPSRSARRQHVRLVVHEPHRSRARGKANPSPTFTSASMHSRAGLLKRSEVSTRNCSQLEPFGIPKTRPNPASGIPKRRGYRAASRL